MLQVILFMLIFSLLIVISVYDLKHKIIPDKLSYSFIILSLFSIFINYSPVGHTFILPSLSNLIAGPAIALPFILIWLFSKGRLMGLGDGKLMLGIGWMLGLSSGVFAVIVAFWVGTIVSLFLIILSKRKINMKTEIPFAPFLIISTFITFLFSFDLFSLVRFLSI
ncbi:MAG TPA: A24 family peptidase [Candidatus Paceibacterota bacterium]|nr:A24 family peptidase [Candidatus Paceibacterota bacterium]